MKTKPKPVYCLRLPDGNLSLWRGRLVRECTIGGRLHYELAGWQRRVVADERDVVLADEQKLEELAV